MNNIPEDGSQIVQGPTVKLHIATESPTGEPWNIGLIECPMRGRYWICGRASGEGTTVTARTLEFCIAWMNRSRLPDADEELALLMEPVINVW